MSLETLLEALDERILDAIEKRATGETIVGLCEARAWLTHPDQAHGRHVPS